MANHTPMLEHASPECRQKQALLHAISDLKELLPVSRRSRGNERRLAKAAEELVKAAEECVDFIEGIADEDNDASWEPDRMKTQVLATLDLAYGTVEVSPNQPVVIRLRPIRQDLAALDRAIAEINGAILNHVPILGDRSSPSALLEASDDELVALGEVIAAHTRDQVYLSLLPDYLRAAQCPTR